MCVVLNNNNKKKCNSALKKYASEELKDLWRMLLLVFYSVLFFLLLFGRQLIFICIFFLFLFCYPFWVKKNYMNEMGYFQVVRAYNLIIIALTTFVAFDKINK